MLTALRTRIYRCIARKYGGRLHASSLRPGYFGGDEAALQQHSNDATFRRRSFREWPRAPTHSGRRLTREAFSIFIVRRADFRRLQTLSVPEPFKVISKRTGFDRALEFNIYGLRLPFGRKYVITSTKEFDRLPKHLLRGPLAPTRIARMHQRHSRAGVMRRHRTTTPLPFENETDPWVFYTRSFCGKAISSPRQTHEQEPLAEADLVGGPFRNDWMQVRGFRLPFWGQGGEALACQWWPPTFGSPMFRLADDSRGASRRTSCYTRRHSNQKSSTAASCMCFASPERH